MANKTVAQGQATQSSQAPLQPPLWIAELNPEVHVKTSLPPQCHSALRAGFAGYSTNPRWNVAKLRAWRLGRQWRDDLAQGEMVVINQFLMTQAESEMQQQEPQISSVEESEPEENLGPLRSLLAWSRKKTAVS